MVKRLNPIDIIYFADKCNAERTYFDNELVAMSFSVARLEDFAYLIEDYFTDEIQQLRNRVAELEEANKFLEADALEGLERALCVIGVVGNIDGHDVIRRESVIDLARDRIHKLNEDK